MFAKLFKFLEKFGVYLAVLSGIIGVYGFVESKLTQNNPEITITKNSAEHLTMLPKADGLVAKFIFKDSVVKDLWKIRFTLENTGKNNLIGRGYQKSLIDSTIKLVLNRGFSSINTSVVRATFPLRPSFSSNKLEFTFDQWRPGELVVFEIYANSSVLQNKIQPNIILMDRQLLNGKAIYKEPSYVSEVKSIYIRDRLPKVIANVLWWFYVLTSIIILIVMPFAVIEENKKRLKYNLWMNVYKNKYDSELGELISSGIVDKYYEPISLPDDKWVFFVVPRIFVKAKPNFSSTVLGALIVFIFFAIPLLWMIKPFWNF
jgi:hypothetical protein